MSETKVCGVCKKEKDVEEFYWKKKGKLRQHKCIPCMKVYSRQYYLEHRDLAITRTKEYKQEQRGYQRPEYSSLRRWGNEE